MTPFLSTTTRRGEELVVRLRTARDRKDIDALVKQMTADLVAELAGGPSCTPADGFLFFVAAAERTIDMPRACAASYDAAGQTAMFAGAYAEALFALEKAEEVRPCPERRKQIKALHQVVRAGVGHDPNVEKPSPARSRSAARTRRA